MLAIASLKALFGPSAYRIYAEAIGRCPTTFLRNVSDPTTITNRLVLTTGALLEEAQAAGTDPHSILTQCRSLYIPRTLNKSWLHVTFEDVLGQDAIGLLSGTQRMSVESVLRAIQKPGARYEPHFRLMALTMLALRAQGRPVQLMQHPQDPAPLQSAA
ncbi:hypothetical protein [Falsigemmobacter intermedius]|uniref:hypothetical protein n=1 Tax=Falsigemmobacter intermedius TaxID=1553448 RepID=UPI003F059F81